MATTHVHDSRFGDLTTREWFAVQVRASREQFSADHLAQRGYEVFHIVLRAGYALHHMDEVLSTWRPLLPQRTLILDDYTRIAELVVATIEVPASHHGSERPVAKKSASDWLPRRV